MAYQQGEPLGKKLTIVMGLTVVALMAFGLALSFYRNALFDQTLERIREKNEELATKNQESRRMIEYYSSSQYKDKYAKQYLGLVREGERILLMERTQAEEDMVPAPDANLTLQQRAVIVEELRSMPVLQHWQLFFSDRERTQSIMEQLREIPTDTAV